MFIPGDLTDRATVIISQCTSYLSDVYEAKIVPTPAPPKGGDTGCSCENPVDVISKVTIMKIIEISSFVLMDC